MVDAACRRGERALYVSYEESQDQVLRNMGSIGLDLNRWVESSLLRLWAVRPAAYGLEEHLVQLQRRLDEFDPSMVVLDAMAGLNHLGTSTSVTATIASQIDMIKTRGVTAVLTALSDELAAELAELDEFIGQDVAAGEGRDADRAVMAAHRWADPGATKDPEANQ